MSIASKIHEAVSRVAPAIGVSIPDAADKSTWRIEFEPETTESQKASAQAVVAAFDPDAILVDNVRAEAQRRIIALVGASDITSCLIKQLNANMRANELNDIRHDRALTEQEQSEADALRRLADAIKAIRAASNSFGDKIPQDYRDNKHWLGG